jgi:PIN domain nuclease of toxin-antitoxin system
VIKGKKEINPINLMECHRNRNLVAADETMARLAGVLRSDTAQAGLSLGDRFCIAHALTKGMEAWTTDRQWQSVTIPDFVVKVLR